MELELQWMVWVSTAVVLFLMAFLVILMNKNTNRRIRHRAELAEFHMQREKEVMSAEREATRQTLREVGQELHDSVGQLLTVAQMGLNAALEERTDAQLINSRDALDQGIEEVRRLSHSLDSELWRKRDLVDAISAEAERIERVGRLGVQVLVKGAVPTLEPETSTILYRVFQEVMNNALKHSKASSIRITLDGGPPFSFTITDNGRGFDVATTPGNGGLHNIHRRCSLVGFTAHCTSTPGNGCTWTFEQQNDHGRA